MTADELDALAVIQAAIRARYQVARHHALSWQPAPVPAPSERKAAADVDGAGT